MNLVQKFVQKRFKKAPMADFSSGDTVQVHVKIVEGEKSRVQIFEGVVTRAKEGGLDSTFTVRKISNGVGVERTFPFYSAAIDRVEVLSRGQTRRARLYYLRNLEGKAARLDSTLETTVAATETTEKATTPQA